MKVIQKTELSDGFLIYLEDGSEIKVSEELYFTRYLYEAEELSKEEIEEIRFRDKVMEAEILCKKRLATGLKPERRLFEYLKAEGFDESQAKTALYNLEKGNYLDDYKLAVRKLRKKMNTSPLASKSLVLWLESQGIDSKTSGQAVEYMNIDDRETARSLMEKRLKKEDDILKIVKYLASRGFEKDIIAEVTETEELWNV